MLINPELLEKRRNRYRRGLPVDPGTAGVCAACRAVKVRALDRDGNSFELETDGLLAICIQHEIDHLDGKLFIDYLSPLKRQRIKQKLEKLARQNARAS